MGDSGRILKLSNSAQQILVSGASDSEPVKGLTHAFYKYPARFSPTFVRAAIEIFTQPGDLILDPHVGGGTSLVEALALGRHAVGVDISALAEFIANVKTTIYTEGELRRVEGWAVKLPNLVNIHQPSAYFSAYAEAGYYKYLDDASRWRLRLMVTKVENWYLVDKLVDHVREVWWIGNTIRYEQLCKGIKMSKRSWALIEIANGGDANHRYWEDDAHVLVARRRGS